MRENKQEIATVVFLIDNGGKSTSVSGPRNPCHAEAGYTMPLQTVQIQISWLLQKPTDLGRHCLPLSL